MSNVHLRAKVRRSIPLGLLGLLGALAAGCGGGAPDDGATTEGTGATSSALIADRKVCWSPLQVRTGRANGADRHHLPRPHLPRRALFAERRLGRRIRPGLRRALRERTSEQRAGWAYGYTHVKGVLVHGYFPVSTWQC